MSRLALVLAVFAASCAAPAPLPVAPPPPPPPVVSAAAPLTVPPPVPMAASLPEEAPAPLPVHRFAAFEPGEKARLFAVRGRLLLRAGERIFSLSPGQMHREPALERALAGSPGSIGGRYPDGLVADRQITVAGERTTVRQYVRLAGGKVTEIARAQRAAMDTASSPTLELVELPDHRLVASIRFDFSEDGPPSWFDFVPGPRPPEVPLHGVGAVQGRSWLVARADGAVALAAQTNSGGLQLLAWAPGASRAVETKLAIHDDEWVEELLETTGGVLYVRTNQAFLRQAGKAWQREAAGAAIRRAWPWPGGGMLLVTTDGEPLLRDAHGTVTRASWPLLTVLGRQLQVSFADARCTREAGFWALAADGLGLYHDRAPQEGAAP